MLNKLIWMNRFNVTEAGKIFGIESQDALDAMDVHGCSKPGIMHLCTRDAMIYKQSTPFVMYLDSIRKNLKAGF